MIDYRRIPFVVLAYGLAGIIPFWLPSVAAVALPSWAGLAGFVLTTYAALILSFLGGARWGQQVRCAPVNPLAVSLSMIPSLAGLAILALPITRPAGLLSLAAALALHWLWDVTSPDLPGWYPRLRSILTAGAVSGLVAGAWVFR